MKLGTETGSLVNHLQARATKGQPAPEVGMGATILMYSDRHAGTITKIEQHDAKGKFIRVTVQHDTATRIDSNGMSESQEYEFTPDPDGVTAYFIREADDQDGRWQEVYKAHTGHWRKANGGSGLRIGVRNQYRDFSF